MKFGRVVYWAFVIFVIYVIIQIIIKILGGSWTTEDLMITLLVTNLGYSYHLTKQMGKLDSKLTKYVGEIDSKISEHLGWHKGRNQ